MLDDAEVASVATVAKPVPRPPDKAAIQYLEASGATAISIVEVDGAAAFRVGTKIPPFANGNFPAIFWIMASDAKPVAKLARRLAGKDQNVGDAVVSLKKAAVECRAMLTPHDVAIQRAAGAAGRLDEYLTSLKGTRTSKAFTHTYRLRRVAAAERGKGFMSYKVAELRLKRALIPLLVNGGKPAVGTSFFTTIFDT
jgi:hypothetical protein